jgi:hypothetical protein
MPFFIQRRGASLQPQKSPQQNPKLPSVKPDPRRRKFYSFRHSIGLILTLLFQKTTSFFENDPQNHPIEIGFGDFF